VEREARHLYLCADDANRFRVNFAAAPGRVPSAEDPQEIKIKIRITIRR
jgi:hypothetical protein